MKMDVNSNGYTFGFAAVLVIVVAALLSFTATSLQEQQEENVAQEKKQNILASIGLQVERADAAQAYEQNISKELVIQGDQKIEGLSAFGVDMAEELKRAPSERMYPLFIANYNNVTSYIIPLRGKGLWGPIWGYIALKEDLNTVIGATFGHKSETPGLGAEISTPIFQDQFPGLEIMEGKQFVSIEVRKGDASRTHQVDGISGGTITSVGVDAMLKDCLQGYQAFFDNEMRATQMAFTSSKASETSH